MDREELCRYVDVSRRHIGCRSGNGIIQCSPVQPIQLIFNLVCDMWYRYRPILQRFCDDAFTVKFYCECDVAKSLRNGPIISLPSLQPS